MTNFFLRRRPIPTMELRGLFVHVYVFVDDALASGAVPLPARPGPVPACSDAEVLTIALARRLLGRPSERAFLAEVRADWAHSFPHRPTQSAFNRRVCWLWGAFEGLRQALVAACPADSWQPVDTTALPVKHPSRVRGADRWDGPGDLHAGFGRDGAHAEWFYDFRLALRTELGSRPVRAWSLVPAAVDEREGADDLRRGAAGPAAGAGVPRRPHTLAPRAPAAGRPRAAGDRPLAQPDRGDQRRADRAVGPGASSGQGLVGVAHPHRCHHLGPHPSLAQAAVTFSSHHAPETMASVRRGC